ncbi:NADP-dependent oxidoreductase [Frankia sp. AgB1.9]|uniref:NADP-dependent oxidoreductase n=1 Tax=unclassified Frankia TaxID=2632575 RepID=UPI0019320CFE|nr:MULTISPECIES: NADP-dependent oxidoreductase [unclassified Frankia]MBL7488876.1 NADP-dependent oxidoreductase [Frankia sp. AgW1.1]MBL7547612.1 NADP-dependent oxidoreductase [Frankia sp. AgB1.9]MBL7621491.1 NADP-dependent oxidoreductase [Frankia sp. AgB1.8]
MRAAVYRRYGGPDVLEIVDLPEPRTHVDSVLVRVRAAGLNAADLSYQAGAMDHTVETFFPVVPGWDIAGVVERAGPAAPEFAPGDEVIGYIRGDVQRAHGGYAEQVAADVRTLFHKPANLSWAQAAALPLGGLTAYQAVRHALAVAPGETLLVHGSGGGVGSLAVQIALATGARVLATASTPDFGYLASLGAEPIAYGPEAAARAIELAPDGVDAVLDAAGRGALADGRGLGGPAVRVASIADFATPGSVPVFARLVHADLAAVVGLAEAGRLTPRVGATYPLRDAAWAQRAMAGGGTRGRVVLEIPG